MSKYTKVSENELAVVETIPEKIIPAETLPAKVYEYSFLKKQVIDIQNQWDEQLAQKNAEIAEINEKRGAEKAEVEKYILEADKLGIAEKIEQPIEEEIVSEEEIILK